MKRVISVSHSAPTSRDLGLERKTGSGLFGRHTDGPASVLITLIKIGIFSRANVLPIFRKITAASVKSTRITANGTSAKKLIPILKKIFL
jgi:hypothetical protein